MFRDVHQFIPSQFFCRKYNKFYPPSKKNERITFEVFFSQSFSSAGSFPLRKSRSERERDTSRHFLWMKIKVCLWIHKTLIKSYGLQANIGSVIDGESFRRSLLCKKKKSQWKSESLRNCINVKHTRQRFWKTPAINFCLYTNWHLPDAIVDHSVSWWISIQVYYNVIN